MGRRFTNNSGVSPKQQLSTKTVNQQPCDLRSPTTAKPKLLGPCPINYQPTTNNDQLPALAPRAELEAEVLEFFVRAAQLLGQPRSLGEIYGLLYLSPEPLSMEQIVQRLEISTGSVSQGLKQLRAFRAVRTAYVPGQRRDFFVAEQELRKVVSGFVQEEIKPHLDSGRERIDRMNAALEAIGGEEKEHFEKRVHRLEKLHSLTGKLLPVMQRFLRI